MKQTSFFAEDKALARLSAMGDPLERLNSVMDWRIFEESLAQVKPDKTQDGVSRLRKSDLKRNSMDFSSLVHPSTL